VAFKLLLASAVPASFLLQRSRVLSSLAAAAPTDVLDAPPDAVALAKEVDAVFATACSAMFFSLEPPLDWARGPRLSAVVRQALQDGLLMLEAEGMDPITRTPVYPYWPPSCWMALTNLRREGLPQLLPRKATVAVVTTIQPKGSADLQRPWVAMSPQLQQQPGVVYGIVYAAAVVANAFADAHLRGQFMKYEQQELKALRQRLLESATKAIGVEVINDKIFRLIEEGYRVKRGEDEQQEGASKKARSPSPAPVRTSEKKKKTPVKRKVAAAVPSKKVEEEEDEVEPEVGEVIVSEELREAITFSLIEMFTDSTILKNVVRFQYVQLYLLGVWLLINPMKLSAKIAMGEAGEVTTGVDLFAILGAVFLCQALQLTAAAQMTYSNLKKTLQYNMIAQLLSGFVALVQKDVKFEQVRMAAVVLNVLNFALSLWACYFREAEVEIEEDDYEEEEAAESGPE